MVAVKRGKSRGAGSKQPAPGKHRHKPAPDVVSTPPPAEGDAVEPVETPVFEIEGAGDGRAAEGAVDDFAGMDAVEDMVDEPADVRRRR